MEYSGSRFYIRQRVVGREQRIEWQVCCGTIRGRCDSQAAAEKLMAYLIREEPKRLAIKYEDLRRQFAPEEKTEQQ